MLPGCEAGRSQALVKAEGEVTLRKKTAKKRHWFGQKYTWNLSDCRMK